LDDPCIFLVPRLLYHIRPLVDPDREWVRRFIAAHWGGELIVVHDAKYLPHTLAGFLAVTSDPEPVGLITYVMENAACEIITLNSTIERKGIGSALISAVRDEALRAACSRVWCITTNDNSPALNFYQRTGFRIVRVHHRAVDRARAIKPSIPPIGLGGVPLHDEIELEIADLAFQPP
jgi:GNAT superfamily N-acetyltransferase